LAVLAWGAICPIFAVNTIFAWSAVNAILARQAINTIDAISTTRTRRSRWTLRTLNAIQTVTNLPANTIPHQLIVIPISLHRRI